MRHRRGVREILVKNGWEEHYIAGQLAGLDALAGDPLPGTRGEVCVCEVEECLSGFVCVEYREWNRLGQLQGLTVDPALKRWGIASVVVCRVEEFVREEAGAGSTRTRPSPTRSDATSTKLWVTGRPTSCPSTMTKGSMALPT
jgi:hypothetical protein